MISNHVHALPCYSIGLCRISLSFSIYICSRPTSHGLGFSGVKQWPLPQKGCKALQTCIWPFKLPEAFQKTNVSLLTFHSVGEVLMQEQISNLGRKGGWVLLGCGGQARSSKVNVRAMREYAESIAGCAAVLSECVKIHCIAPAAQKSGSLSVGAPKGALIHCDLLNADSR